MIDQVGGGERKCLLIGLETFEKKGASFNPEEEVASLWVHTQPHNASASGLLGCALPAAALPKLLSGGCQG